MTAVQGLGGEWGVVATLQPPQHSHTVRGTQFHGLQFKVEGQETFTARYADLQLGNPANNNYNTDTDERTDKYQDKYRA